jgi:hypothetical protein
MPSPPIGSLLTSPPNQLCVQVVKIAVSLAALNVGRSLKRPAAA